MKKSILILVVAFLFNSCSQSITFNKEAYQGFKNNFFWEANEYSVTVAKNGLLSITGGSTTDQMVISLSSAGKGTYILGENYSKKVIYTDKTTATAIVFDTTIARPGGNNGGIIGDGEVIITANDGATISGKFKFNAVNADANSDQVYVNFKEGVFNNIPITSL